jgi:predicted TIM-barrel fold metal-dependent hydrolase
MNELKLALWQRRPQQATTILDAHAHLGPYGKFFIPDHDRSSMIRVMDRCGVSTAIFSSHLAIQIDSVAGNALTAAEVTASGGRLRGYLVANPWQDPLAELERWALDDRFVGIKLHPDMHDYPLTGPRYAPVWTYAARHRLPVLTHTWGGSPNDGPAVVERIAAEQPEVTFLAGHAGSPETDAMIAVAKRHSNVLLEVCGSVNSGTRIARMVDSLGPGRVVFGSDFPFIDLRSSLGRLVFCDIDDRERDNILGKTVLGVLDAIRRPAR